MTRQSLSTLLLGLWLWAGSSVAQTPPAGVQVVQFPNGDLKLGGELYKPEGAGPFPAVLYNHGSAPGMFNSQASQALGPRFAAQGWVFFMPYRRGQGLSAKAGPYIGDELSAARRQGGAAQAASRLAALMRTDHWSDQLAALQWLRAQPFVAKGKVATAGNSFGGVQVVLGAAQGGYCAGVDASGAAESWAQAPELQTLMKDAVRSATAPVFFFQAENDFDLLPSKTLYAEMQQANKVAELRIYPAWGQSSRDGHAFAYQGADVWMGDVMGFLRRNCTP